MVVIGTVLAASLAAATALMGWMTAWHPVARVLLFASFAANGTAMAAAAGRSTPATAVAAAAVTTTLIGLARMATRPEAPRAARRSPGTDLLASIIVAAGRQRRWTRLERAFRDHVAGIPPRSGRRAGSRLRHDPATGAARPPAASR